jgi:hypothetical protein
MSEEQPDIHAILICEDVRHEVNNKHSLIGVFSGDIQVSKFPANINVAAFASVNLRTTKTRRLLIEVKYDGQTHLKMEGEISATKTLGTIGLPTPQLRLGAAKAGELEIIVSVGDSTLVAKKSIIEGEVPSPFRTPSG